MSDIPSREALRRVQTLALGQLSSTMLGAAFRLEAFDKLGEASLSPAEAATLWGIPARSARVLTQFLCNMGVLQYEQGRVQNTPTIAAFLALNPEVRNATIAMCGRGPTVDELTDQLRDPPPQPWYQIHTGEKTADATMGCYSARMHRKRVHWGEQLARQYDFAQHTRLLDVAGATGGWCVGIRRRFPDLACTVFDLPAACAAAAGLVEAYPEIGELTHVPGDVFADALPQDADVALLAHVLHDWSAADGRAILRTLRRAFEPGATLLVKEYFHADDWSNSIGEAARQAFHVLGTEGRSGWQPSYGEMEQLLSEEGFIPVRREDDLIIAKAN